MKAICGIFLLIGLAQAAGAQQAPAPAPTAQPNFRISGKVVNALGGQLLANAEVILGPTERPEPARSVITGPDGSFQFDGMAQGKYWLVAQARGFARQGLNEHEVFFTGVAVGPGLRSEVLLFRLRPDASVSGTITDEQNEGIRDAQVMLFHTRLENGQRTTQMQTQSSTDDQGHYHFRHLSPGIYFVAVSAHPWYAQRPQQRITRVLMAQGEGTSTEVSGPGASQEEQVEDMPTPLDVAYPIMFWVSTADASQAAALVLRPGDRATADVVLTALPALHLRIKGVNADPTQPYAATLVEHLFDGSTIQVSGENSRIGNDIEITGAPPGPMEVNVQSFGKNPATWSETVDLANDLEINAGETSPSPQISGVVQADGTAAPQGTYVTLRNRASGFAAGAQLGTKGEFQIENSNIKPGTYEVFVNVPGAVVRAISASGAKVVGQDVEISGGGPVHLAVLVSQKLGRVNGVASRNGKPEAGVMIVLVPPDPENNAGLFRRDQSDSDGTFTLRGVLPGKYRVVAIANGWDLEWMKPAVLKPYLKDGEVVEVAAGGKSQVQVKVQ